MRLRMRLNLQHLSTILCARNGCSVHKLFITPATLCTKHPFRAQTTTYPSNFVHKTRLPCTNHNTPQQLCAQNTPFVHQPRHATATLCTKHPFRAQTLTYPSNFVHKIPLPCTNHNTPQLLCAQNTPFVHKPQHAPATMCTKHPFRAQYSLVGREKICREEPRNLCFTYCICKKKHYLCKI